MEGELTIWTVGHSTLDLEEFLDVLGVNNIEAVADVRRYPGSRRYPQFNMFPLKSSLLNRGIVYEHINKLGGRRRAKPDSPNTVWRSTMFRGYADHMETGEFREGISSLRGLARGKRTAVMCAEAVWWRCHRALISDYLKVAGVGVAHIMDKSGVNVMHPFTSAARVENGKLIYGEKLGPPPDS